MSIKTVLYNYTASTPDALETVHTAATTPIAETNVILYMNIANLHASNDIRIMVTHVRGGTSTKQSHNSLLPFGMSMTIPEPGQKWTLEPGDSIQVSAPSSVDITISYGIV